MTRISELIVYREFEQGQLLEDMTWIMDPVSYTHLYHFSYSQSIRTG